MKTRKDGEATRESILEAACQVFGDKGFNKATHAEICLKAGVNTALINFHFGSKDELYRAAWDRVARTVNQLYPMDGGIQADAPAALRLRGHIRTLMNIALDPKMEAFHRIRVMEMINPTGLLDEAITRHIEKHRSFIQGIIRDLLGPSANDHVLELCEMSVMSQCHMILPRLHSKCKKTHRKFKHTDVESLTEHITCFSLAGIEAVRSMIDSDGSGDGSTRS